ncbi:MAG: manganese efflux pump [Bacteroidales bacterium]|jgi:putative Mn2+ efflux pump MntP|nr:manganese efflux pump [Bacteroidales bacterium]MDD3286961.1 manganese efflux pump [Bacteroidales bacterium]MDD4738852.1 manganese efflux pump [Bacteroidales bacterium]
MISFIFSALLIGVALSMDSLAVSITCGLQKSMTKKRAFILALSFAIFQGFFPLIGALVGDLAKEYISDIDHWIAFGLLAIIGIKMFMEGIRYNMKECLYDFTKLSILITLSVATSIDAFIVGIGFGLQYSIQQQLIIVALITLSTFIFSLLGAFMGMKAYFFKPKIALKLGGIILFSIGLKIFLEHIMA